MPAPSARTGELLARAGGQSLKLSAAVMGGVRRLLDPAVVVVELTGAGLGGGAEDPQVGIAHRRGHVVLCGGSARLWATAGWSVTSGSTESSRKPRVSAAASICSGCAQKGHAARWTAVCCEKR